MTDQQSTGAGKRCLAAIMERNNEGTDGPEYLERVLTVMLKRMTRDQVKTCAFELDKHGLIDRKELKRPSKKI